MNDRPSLFGLTARLLALLWLPVAVGVFVGEVGADDSPKKNIQHLHSVIQSLKTKEAKTNQQLKTARTRLKAQQIKINALYAHQNRLSATLRLEKRKLDRYRVQRDSAKKEVAERHQALYKAGSLGFLLLQKKERRGVAPPSLATEYFYKKILLHEETLLESAAKSYERYNKKVGEVEAQRKKTLSTAAAVRSNLKKLSHLQKKAKQTQNDIQRELKSTHGERIAKEKELKELEDLVDGLARKGEYQYADKHFANQKGKLKIPFSYKLVHGFGYRKSSGLPPSQGWLLKVRRGSAIRALFSGEVIYADYLRGFDFIIIIAHGNNYFSVYGHNDALTVKKGDKVHTGNIIAYAGSGDGLEGASYIGIRHGANNLDPSAWIRH